MIMIKVWTIHLLCHFDVPISLQGQKIWVCSVIWCGEANPVLLWSKLVCDLVYIIQNCPLCQLLTSDFTFLKNLWNFDNFVTLKNTIFCDFCSNSSWYCDCKWGIKWLVHALIIILCFDIQVWTTSKVWKST